jgi:hypothetical protein
VPLRPGSSVSSAALNARAKEKAKPRANDSDTVQTPSCNIDLMRRGQKHHYTSSVIVFNVEVGLGTGVELAKNMNVKDKRSTQRLL